MNAIDRKNYYTDPDPEYGNSLYGSKSGYGIFPYGS